MDRLIGSGRPNDMSPFIKAMFESASVPVMLRCIVAEVLFDPASLTDEKKQALRKRFSARLELLDVAPHNSVIAVPARGNGEVLNKPIILYPFFGSHFVPPLKVGEHTWAVFETQETRELGYWMSRIAENRLVEDPNFTHSDRRFLAVGRASLKEKAGADPIGDTSPGFPNGMGIPETFTLPQDTGKNAYDELDETADASKLHVTEPVPRYRKRPGDFVIAGSNNTLISLGIDRAAAPADLGLDGSVEGLPEGDQVENAGTVEIVVGRGQSEVTAPPTVKNTRGLLETDKNPFASSTTENTQEGDLDYATDLSRISVSMSTAADALLGVFDKLPNVKTASAVTAPAIVMKSDQLRFVARQDVKIIVAPPDADVDDVTKLDKFASFVITTTGDIVFAPARDGAVKLGGSDADRAILCTDQPVTLVDGQVVSPPLATTMGGLIGTGVNGLGTFSTKVLVKGD